jgi:hypothetical protein
MKLVKRGTTYHIRRRVPHEYGAAEAREVFCISLKTDSLVTPQSKAPAAWTQLVERWQKGEAPPE